jgi:hypothetical protein
MRATSSTNRPNLVDAFARIGAFLTMQLAVGN